MEGSGTTSLAPITTAMGTVVEVTGQVFTVMVNNPLLVVFMASSLLVMGVRLFRKLKGAARG